MGRLLLACVLGCAIFALAAWQLGFIGSDKAPAKGSLTSKAAKATPNLGPDLYDPAPSPPAAGPGAERRVDPVVVQGTMAVIDRAEIAAQVAGQLLFFGEEIPEGAAQAAGVAVFMANPFESTEVNHGTRDVVQFYRRLYENDIVYAGQVLALVDTAKVLSDLEMKKAKLIAAENDSKGADAIAAEANNKFKQAEEAYYGRLGRNISVEEYRNAELTKNKMKFDSLSKQSAWEVAKVELTGSQIINKQHRITDKAPGTRGIIQKIYKKRAEAVKEQEPVVEVYGVDRLQAEAPIDDYYGKRVREGMRVTIEPTLVDSAPKIYRAHTAAVNCLAVTSDAQNPLIVSGSEDRRVLVWTRFGEFCKYEFKHPEAVKAMVVSPRGAAANFILTGCADGSLRLYDLDSKDPHKCLVKDPEQGIAVTALAFSPDGKYFASGTADGSITLWATANLEKIYDFDDAHGVSDPHHGPISSLRLTPQCKLVSASLDNTIHVWSLKAHGATLDYSLPGRSGNVGQLDVSSDGRWMVFDQGKTLQIQAVNEGGRLINTLQNPGGAIPFETLALFSPDASLMLTAGASEGRLQLWHLPEGGTARGFEVRQFAVRERGAPVTCAAFAPLSDYDGEGSFAVSANKDGQIYLWPLPLRKDVDNHQIRNVRLRFTGPGINPSTRQTTIGVIVPNPASEAYPNGRLEPGRPVTIVIE
jgi:WD40 repeat protein